MFRNKGEESFIKYSNCRWIQKDFPVWKLSKNSEQELQQYYEWWDLEKQKYIFFTNCRSECGHWITPEKQKLSKSQWCCICCLYIADKTTDAFLETINQDAGQNNYYDHNSMPYFSRQTEYNIHALGKLIFSIPDHITRLVFQILIQCFHLFLFFFLR